VMQAYSYAPASEPKLTESSTASSECGACDMLVGGVWYWQWSGALRNE
jgi:hypothetical protein